MYVEERDIDSLYSFFTRFATSVSYFIGGFILCYHIKIQREVKTYL